MRSKLTVVGVGDVGTTAALLIARRDYADLVFLDTDGDAARAREADVASAVATAGHEPLFTGTVDWSEAAGSSVVVITAGLEAAERFAGDLGRCCPDAIIVVAAEPVMELCRALRDATLFPRQRVIGVRGVVEAARMRVAAARELGTSVRDVSALVVGGEGGALVPVLSCATVAGTPLTQLLDGDRLDAVVRAVHEPATGPVAVAAAAAEVVDAIVSDRRRVLPCAALCQGEYGLDGIFATVPVRLGRDGIEEIVEIALTDDEREHLSPASSRAASSGA